MHSLTSPMRTPPHGSTSYPHASTAPTPPRKTQTHLPLPNEARRPQLDTPPLHCFHTRIALGLFWVYPPGICRKDAPALVPAPGRLDLPTRAPRGGKKTQSCLCSTVPRREPKPRLAPGATPRQREGLVCGGPAPALGAKTGTPPLHADLTAQ